jgi:hypothetical protein
MEFCFVTGTDSVEQVVSCHSLVDHSPIRLLEDFACVNLYIVSGRLKR